MIPTGGLSVFIHLCVNIYASIARVFPVLKVPFRTLPVAAPILSVGLAAVMIYFAGMLLINALNDDNNYDHLVFLMNRCEEIKPVIGEQNIIIRIDDIQAFAWTDISKKMIEDAGKRDIPLSLAVIPLNLRDDFTFYEFLREKRCMMEFALHGWDNQEPEPFVGEFAFLSKEDAAERLEKGINTLDRLSREEVVTFVPPLNMLSDGTQDALKELEIPIISSYGTGTFDYDATTFDFTDDVLLSAEDVLQACKETFATGENTCIVMIHPQDFVTDNVLDPKKYLVYTDTLDVLKQQGYTFVRFKDFKHTVE